MIYDSRHPSLGGRSVGGHDCGDYQTTGEKAINFSLPDWVVAVGLASLYNDILWFSLWLRSSSKISYVLLSFVQ